MATRAGMTWARMGDAAASSRAVTGRRSTFARRGGGGKAGDGVPVDSEMTRVRPGDDAMNRGQREDAGACLRRGAVMERAGGGYRSFPGRRGCARVVTRCR